MTSTGYELRADATEYGDPLFLGPSEDLFELEADLRDQTATQVSFNFMPLQLCRIRRLEPAHSTIQWLDTPTGSWNSFGYVLYSNEAITDEVQLAPKIDVPRGKPLYEQFNEHFVALWAPAPIRLRTGQVVPDIVSTRWAPHESKVLIAEAKKIQPRAMASQFSAEANDAPHSRAAAEIRRLAGMNVETVASFLGVSAKSYYRWLAGERITDLHRTQIHYLHALLADVARRLRKQELSTWLVQAIGTTDKGPVTPLQLLQRGRFEELYQYITDLPDPEPVIDGAAVGLLRRPDDSSEDWD